MSKGFENKAFFDLSLVFNASTMSPLRGVTRACLQVTDARMRVEKSEWVASRGTDLVGFHPLGPMLVQWGCGPLLQRSARPQAFRRVDFWSCFW